MMRPHFLQSIFLACLLFATGRSTLHAQSTAGRLSLPELQAIYEQADDTTYVINFWATWCGPCVMEMPALMQFYAATQNKPVRFLLISLDQPKFEKQVNNFLQKNQIKAPVYILNAGKNFDWLPQVDPRWQGSIPATLIVNNSKKIRQFLETSLEPGQLEYYLKKLGLD